MMKRVGQMVFVALTLAAIAARPAAAQELPGNGYPAERAKCAHNPPEWYGFSSRPDCARNWPNHAGAWDFVDDFRVGVDAQNPSPDSYGNSAAWQYRQAPSGWTPGDWAAAGLLPSFGQVGDPSLNDVGWLATNPLPFIGTAAPLHAGYAHPATGVATVVDWRAPRSGKFWINLEVVHGDPTPNQAVGDGVRWSLYAWTASGSVLLIQSGVVDKTHVSDSIRLQRVDLIEGGGNGGVFLVFDPQTDISYDTVRFRLTILGTLDR